MTSFWILIIKPVKPVCLPAACTSQRCFVCVITGSTVTNARCVCVCYSDEVPNDLSGRLYHLEVMLKQLNNDLEKVRAFCFSL